MKSYLVIGLGKTGQALIEFLLARGESCIAFEELSEENYQLCLKKFQNPHLKLFFKELPSSVFDEVKEVLTSPGVPLTRSWVQQANHRGIPVIGELEFAFRYLQGSILAVTGTNGKSTTVSLCYEILKEGGGTVSLKGNIGDPLINAVRESPRDYYVVEVSSYQLETIKTFHPKISVFLNLTEDHLDRYSSMNEYGKAKAKIFMNQTSSDFFIYNADDPYCVRFSSDTKAKRLAFSLVNHLDEGGFIDGNDMVIRFGKLETRYPLKEASLQGMHQQENMLATLLACHAIGVSSSVIARVLKNFRGLPHRMELVGKYGGISFYDDSKATNVGSVVMSLASFEKNILLILGGRDKKGDYAPLKSLIEAKVKEVILIGEAALKIKDRLGSIKPMILLPSMKEALEYCHQKASSGDTVLLSPACSSFDQYKNYEERGKDFRKWVQFYFYDK